MIRYVAAFAACAVAMIVLDMIWLGLVAKNAYQQGIGHLMAPKPNVPAAAVFYLLYAMGVMVFAVAPASQPAGWGPTLGRGALLGLVAYATYDLSNLATLQGWPLSLALMDIGWGVTITVLSTACGKLALGSARLP